MAFPASAFHLRITAFIAGWLLIPLSVCAGTIDTDFIQRAWSRERVQIFEVGRYPVRWRQWVSRQEGLFAGIRFEVPLHREKMWELSTDYSTLGQMTPGVRGVDFLEVGPDQQLIQIEIKVLWKVLRLNFEIERAPPEILRFRLVNDLIGEYRGVCVFEDIPDPSVAHTRVEMSTWLKPVRPLPLKLIAVAQRMIFLQATKEFLEACEPRTTPT